MLKEPIVINNFQNGMAKSPHFGMQTIYGCDVNSVLGEITSGIDPAKDNTDVTFAGTPLAIAYNPNNGNYYTVTSDRNVYNVTDSYSDINGHSSTGSACNLVYWKDYLFLFLSNKIDVYGPLSGTPAWTNSWQSASMPTAPNAPAMVASDDAIYFSNGSTLGKISEATAPFTPGTLASYNFQASALDLPAHYTITSLAEMGDDLYIGTVVRPTSPTISGDIFPWDKVSTSFRTPIKLAEDGIYQMLSANNMLYIVAGTRGNVYISNGATVQPLHKLPLGLAVNSTISYSCNGIAHWNGKVLIGTYTGTSGTSAIKNMLYSIDTENNNALRWENSISTGTFIMNNKIGCIRARTSFSYYVGWGSTNTYGMDSFTMVDLYNNYESYFETAMYQVGGNLTKHTFKYIEVLFANALSSGQGVKLSYRKNLSDNYTSIGTFDYTTYGAKKSINIPFGATNIETIQFKVEINRARVLQLTCL